MGIQSMTTSRQRRFLSEILEGGPISEDKLVYFRERLRDRLHSAILAAFQQRAEKGFKQSDLADRIHKKRAQITRWLGSPSNLTLDSISDLMVGMGMDFDEFPFTPIEVTILTSQQQAKQAALDATIKEITDKLASEWGGGLQNWQRLMSSVGEQRRRKLADGTMSPPVAITNVGAAFGAVETIQKRTDTKTAKIVDLAAYVQRKTEDQARRSETHLPAVGVER
jgi:transcriptional regulator with XRE-family HTH domain